MDATIRQFTGEEENCLLSLKDYIALAGFKDPVVYQDKLYEWSRRRGGVRKFSKHLNLVFKYHLSQIENDPYLQRMVAEDAGVAEDAVSNRLSECRLQNKSTVASPLEPVTQISVQPENSFPNEMEAILYRRAENNVVIRKFKTALEALTRTR
ncbi:MAG: hypothetical protein AABY26_02205, partial [Nanoarchaeota archaeon]